MFPTVALQVWDPQAKPAVGAAAFAHTVALHSDVVADAPDAHIRPKVYVAKHTSSLFVYGDVQLSSSIVFR